MAAPVVIEPIIQKSNTDCAIAAIAMILGKPYAEVRDLSVVFWGEDSVDKHGLTVRDAQRIAHHFKAPLQSVAVKDAQLDSETGLLYLRMRRDYHVVVLFQGVVFNPADGVLWDLDTFKATRHATPVRFLRP